MPIQCQVPCILLIIQNLNVTLKSVADLMSPSKCCVVNVKLAFPRNSLSLFKDSLLNWSEFADVDMRKMITCPTDALICGCKGIRKWRNRLPQLHNEFDWVLQYYSRLQHVKLQLSFAYTLKVTSTLICDCCGESLLIVSFISKCWLQLKFQTSYYFHKSYSYCLWPPQLPIFETSFVQLSMPNSPDLSSALYQMEICNVLLLLCKHSGNSDLAENVSLSKASIRILCSR